MRYGRDRRAGHVGSALNDRLVFPQAILASSTAVAICYVTREIVVSRASRVRWWYQAARAWWRRRQSSQCAVAAGWGGRAGG